MSITVFFKPDEFRFQSGHFANARLLTVQECPAGARLLEDIWKPWVGGEELASRPNYGKDTEQYDWANAGKFWEINREAPAITVADASEGGLTPFTRRILVIKLHSHFTGDELKVDHARFVYKQDPTLRDFLRSPVARHCRLRDHLLLVMQRFTVEELLDFLAHPDDSIVAATLALVQKMASGGVRDAADGDVGVVDVADAKTVLLDIHENVRVRNWSMRTYLVLRCDKLKGSQKAESTPGKPNRIDTFKAMIEAFPFLFKFDEAGGVFRKLDFDVAGFRRLAAAHDGDVVGDVEHYPIVFDVRARIADSLCTEDQVGIEDAGEELAEATPALTQMAADTDAASFTEIVNLTALRQYAARRVDRRQRQLNDYIRRVQREGTQDADFPGMVCVDVPYVRKRGLPGRRYAVGLSLQTLTKEARAMACSAPALAEGQSAQLFDLDFKNCIPALCWLHCVELGLDHECTSLARFVADPDAWKRLLSAFWGVPVDEAKKEILRVFFGGFPKEGNPLLWGLASDVLRLRDELLSHAQCEYLADQFADRDHPLRTRCTHCSPKRTCC